MRITEYEYSCPYCDGRQKVVVTNPNFAFCFSFAKETHERKGFPGHDFTNEIAHVRYTPCTKCGGEHGVYFNKI